MDTREFLEKEQALARRFGVRKLDVMLQSLRCTSCGANALRVQHLAGARFSSLDEMERPLIAAIREQVDATCARCEQRPLAGDGRRHLLLAWCDRRSAHVAVSLRLNAEDDGRVKVVRRAWWIPLTRDAEEIGDSDERLVDAWLDSAVRQAATLADTDAAVEALQALAEVHTDDAVIRRELGLTLLEQGRTDVALPHLERSLEQQPDQPEVLRRVGRIHASWGDGSTATDLLVRAHDLTNDPTLLEEILRASWQGRRYGAMDAAALALLEDDPEHQGALKARVCTASGTDLTGLRDAWRDLGAAARAAGERATAAVADHWLDALDVPWPDMHPGEPLELWWDDVRETLVDLGWTLRRPTGEEPVDRATLPDAEVTGPDGSVWLLWAVPSRFTPWVSQRIRAALRFAHEDAERTGARFVVLSPQPVPWAIARYAARVPDALLDLTADADSSMTVVDENAASFAAAAETVFGRELTEDLDSLAEVDAILARYHDHGFGEMTWALQCQIAAWVGHVVCLARPGAAWGDGDDDMDPRVLVLPDSGQVNLVSKVGKAVRNGDEDSLAHFAEVLLATLSPPEAS